MKMNKFLILLIGIIMGIGGFVCFIHSFNNIHITAVFEELEPFPRNLNVYYKGFKLGRSIRVRPSKNFTTTNVEMILHAKNLALPDNITAKVKRKDKKDYIELEYPTAPSVTLLKNHSLINGKKSFNITSYIDQQADGGGLDELKDNLSYTVASAGETMEALTDLFNTGNEILNDLKPSLKATGENLVVTSKNLAEVSTELNKSVKKGNRLDNSFANIELTTRNIEFAARHLQNASLNLSNLTNNANRDTMQLINCILQNTNDVILNINDIIQGFQSTLSKRFAGIRVFFGKAID